MRIVSTYFLVICLPVLSAFASDKPLQTTDFIYEPQIRTVLFYPKSPEADPVSAPLQPPVVSLRQPIPLVLEFDELGDKIHYYRARIYHCNADWKLSNLNDMDILPAFNDFIFDQPKLSSNNARIHYTHQRIELPQVKLSGNYIAMVYREGNPKDIVVTRRFIVYDSRLSILPRVTFSTGIVERNTNQQIEFTIDYGNLNVGNPWTNLKVVIRQNYRWYNALTNLTPTVVREDKHQAEYRHFNLENNFSGVNEFRFFDIRSIRSIGQNVGRVKPAQDTTQIYLAANQSHGRESYTQVIDQNGQYLIDHYELSNGDIEADYVRVYFTLKAEPVREPVYIWGELSNWQATPQNQMIYDTGEEVYRGSLLLKQGYYNFRYVLKKPDGTLNESFFEGNHFETENAYEIIVYNRPPGARADMIIGYVLIPYNSRR